MHPPDVHWTLCTSTSLGADPAGFHVSLLVLFTNKKDCCSTEVFTRQCLLWSWLHMDPGAVALLEPAVPQLHQHPTACRMLAASQQGLFTAQVI